MHGLPTIADFVIIAKKSAVVDTATIINKLTNTRATKQKNGNKTFRSLFTPDTKAVSVSCQLYLLRKDYAITDNWKIYKDWSNEYPESETAQSWVEKNQDLIRTF